MFSLFLNVENVSAQGEIVAGELIIKLKEGVDKIDAQFGMALQGITIVETILELGLIIVKLPPELLEELQNSLSLDPDFAYVVKNHIVHATATPNDTSFNLQSFFSVFDAP